MRHQGNEYRKPGLPFIYVLLFPFFSLLKIMASKALLSFFIIFSSFVHPGFSDSSIDQLLGGLGQFSAIQEAECMQKLLPCKTFLKSPNNPSPACCLPLNEMVTNETQCLCSFINNPQLFLSINISKEDILNLPNACGINVDISICDSEASSASSNPSAGLADIVPADEAPPAEDSTSSTKMITPNGIIHFGVPGFVVFLTTALVFSAY